MNARIFSGTWDRAGRIEESALLAFFFRIRPVGPPGSKPAFPAWTGVRARPPTAVPPSTGAALNPEMLSLIQAFLEGTSADVVWNSQLCVCACLCAHVHTHTPSV